MACGWGFGLNMVDRLVVAYQVKWNLISSINIILYMLPHNLPKKVRLRILANQRILKLAMRLRILGFSGLYFLAFGLNMDQKNSEYRPILRSVSGDVGQNTLPQYPVGDSSAHRRKCQKVSVRRSRSEFSVQETTMIQQGDLVDILR